LDEQGTKTRDEGVAAHDARDQHGLIGKVIDGRFAIESVIGKGGMGIVYLGHQTNVDRRIAIKVLLPERCDQETVLRFQNEAKAASALSHPNTITIHDFGAWGELLYIAMEFLEGQSLQDVMNRERRIEPMRLARITAQVLASLQEAHQVGIIHRDIKPDNVFLKTVGGQPDFVKVLDFGVAKLGEQLRGGDATLTKAGMIFGTPKYMSPEQATARKLDARTDLYSVAVMMYEGLCGRPVFEASDPVSILIQHVHDDPPPFAEMAPDLQVPPELEAIVMRALMKKPEQRFESAAEMRAAIEHVMLMMQAHIATIQGQALAGSATGSLYPGYSPSSGPTSALPSPTPSGPMRPPHTPSPSGGTWSDHLGVGGVEAGPSSGLGGPVSAGPMVVRTGGNRGLLLAVIMVGVLLLGAVAYLVIGVGDSGEPTSDAGSVSQPDAEEAPDTALASLGDAGAPLEDEVGVPPEFDGGVAAVTDAEAVAEDTGAPPEESDLGLASLEPDAGTPEETDAGSGLEDALAFVDEPSVEEPDALGAEDAVALVEEDAVEVPARDLVRVRFEVEPGSASARFNFGRRDFERQGEFYVFDRADGDRFRVTVSASRYRQERVNVDLSQAGGDGSLRVRVRLQLDPCDPANGPVDPYVCN
jgi:eukaryotic-like serine/threonine-protein kinase